jgi:class 3 adenylate cyclase
MSLRARAEISLSIGKTTPPRGHADNAVSTSRMRNQHRQTGRAQTREEPAAPPVSAAERRQLSVMFCDLVGSTALSTRTDPEDLMELIGAYHRATAECVARFGGYVVKYMGDGVLAYFGYPQAHEDETQGFMKALVGASDDDRILGFTMIGAEAGEVMAVVQTAMLADLPYLRLRDAILAHPTMAEGLGDLFAKVPPRSGSCRSRGKLQCWMPLLTRPNPMRAHDDR